MRIAILTNEYPPHIYGGAGVHVDYLTRELAKLSDGSKCSLRILCFGDQDQESHHIKVKGNCRAGATGGGLPPSPEAGGHPAAQRHHDRGLEQRRTLSTATPGTPTWPAAC